MWVKTSDHNAAQDSPNALETSPGQVHPPSYRDKNTWAPQIHEPNESFHTKHASSIVGLLLFFLLKVLCSQTQESHRYDVSTQAMCSVSALNDCTQLRITHAGLLASGAHRTYAYENMCENIVLNLNTIWNFGKRWLMMSPGPMPTLMMSAPARISSSTISPVTTLPAYKTQTDFKILRWLLKRQCKKKKMFICWCLQVTDHDSVRREHLPHVFHKVDKVFGVAIGYIHTNVLNLRYSSHNGPQSLKIPITRPRADGYTLEKERKKVCQCVSINNLENQRLDYKI